MPKLPAALILAALAWAPRSALAFDCHRASGLSPCIDADLLWLPAGQAHFASISGAQAAEPGKLSFALVQVFSTKPIVFNVASPEREGREVEAVKEILNLTPLFAWGLLPNLELTLATPMTLSQVGSGIAALTTQSGPPLARTSVRDPRLGAAYALDFPAHWLKTKLKFELKLPLGDEQSFAGEESAVAVPALALEALRGRFRAGLELGLRLRPQQEIASVRVGNQVFAALGVRFDLLGHELLSLGLEAWAIPSLNEEPSSTAGEAVTAQSYVPSEWFVTLGSALVPDSRLHLLIGAGGGLPLSSETRRDAGETTTEYFAGLGTPAFRSLVSLRYVPR